MPAEFVSLLVNLKPLIDILNELVSFCTTVTQRANEAIEKIHSLEVDEADLKWKFVECEKKLKQSKCKTETYVRSVKKLLRFANISDTEWKRLVDGNVKPLQDYLKQIVRYVGQCKDHYTILYSELEEALNNLESITSLCAKKQAVAKGKSTAAKAVGGTASAAVIAAGLGTGVSLSIVAGVCTLGVGAVLGLSLTAVGTIIGGPVIGAGAGVATHCIASYYEKLRQTFKSIWEDFNRLNRDARNLDGNLCKLNEVTAAISDDTFNVQQTIAEEAEHALICQMFEVFLKGIRDLYDRVMSYNSDGTVIAEEPN